MIAIKTFEQYKSHKPITAYHRAKNSTHLDNLTIDDTNTDYEFSIFGKAIYFSSSTMTSNTFGNYMDRYEIVLDNPLNLNIEMTNDDANNYLNNSAHYI